MTGASNNSEEKWVLKEHSQVKHDLLRKYLVAWARVLRDHFPSVVYIDGFAGRGQYEDGQPGSPLIALEIAREAKIRHMHAYFIERDPNNAENLRRVLRQHHRTSGSSGFFPQVCEGTFEEEAPKILANIRRNIPCFVFIDPWGFSGVPFSLVKAIMSRPHTEIFLTFMTRDLSRFLTSTAHHHHIDEIMGTTNWRQIIDQGLKGEHRQFALAELYRQQLHKEAHVKYTWRYRISMPDQRRTIYYLVFGTNHFRGLDIMKGVMYGAGGLSYAYWGPDESFRKIQTSMFELVEEDIPSFAKKLHERFVGQSLTYFQVKERTYMETTLIDKHYRKAIKWLEKHSLVEVKRVASKRSGVKDDDVIHFKPKTT